MIETRFLRLQFWRVYSSVIKVLEELVRAGKQVCRGNRRMVPGHAQVAVVVGVRSLVVQLSRAPALEDGIIIVLLVVNLSDLALGIIPGPRPVSLRVCYGGLQMALL